MDDEEFNEEDDEGPYSDKNLEMPDEEENEETFVDKKETDSVT